MKRCKGSLLLAVLLVIAFPISRASAQIDRITIAAGTDEDHALQAITAEQDNQKSWPCTRTLFRSSLQIRRQWLTATGKSLKPIRLPATYRKRWTTVTKLWPDPPRP